MIKDVVKVGNENILNEVLNIRKIVFINEQNVSLEEEIDEYDIIDDEYVIHFAIYVNNKIIGTLRLLNNDDYVKIGRVAILKQFRKQGLGEFLIKEVITYTQSENIFDIKNKFFYLESQTQAIEFYQKLGFKEYGDIFLDANIEHKKMSKHHV